MTIPFEYQRATEDFYALMDRAKEQADLVSMNQAYTMIQGVFRVFRRRLEMRDAIQFASVLPVGARALFVADWDLDEPIREFASRVAMTDEVRAFRAQHNFSPNNAISCVAIALRKHVDIVAFEQLLPRLPHGAAAFWEP